MTYVSYLLTELCSDIIAAVATAKCKIKIRRV